MAVKRFTMTLRKGGTRVVDPPEKKSDKKKTAKEETTPTAFSESRKSGLRKKILNKEV